MYILLAGIVAGRNEEMYRIKVDEEISIMSVSRFHAKTPGYSLRLNFFSLRLCVRNRK